jgi:hypothetical protein
VVVVVDVLLNFVVFVHCTAVRLYYLLSIKLVSLKM